MPAKYKDYVLTRVSMNSVETLNMYGTLLDFIHFC